MADRVARRVLQDRCQCGCGWTLYFCPDHASRSCPCVVALVEAGVGVEHLRLRGPEDWPYRVTWVPCPPLLVGDPQGRPALVAFGLIGMHRTTAHGPRTSVLVVPLN
jgi:hypothetical protein